MDDASFYTELVEELGFDPLNPDDPSYDDYRTASQMYTEARLALSELVTIPLNQ